jgi:uncharacterized protein (DUF1501 family)
VKQAELQEFLTGFAADRLALLQRHEAGARAVSHYDFNNTYQYVISREETHLSWLQDALAEFGGALPQPSSTLAVPAAPKPGKHVDAASFRGILEDDTAHLGAFVSRWSSRIDSVTHARHRTMLNVVIGESLEHQRFFEQAAAGFEDLLGRRTGGVPRQGAVLSSRWME